MGMSSPLLIRFTMVVVISIGSQRIQVEICRFESMYLQNPLGNDVLDRLKIEQYCQSHIAKCCFLVSDSQKLVGTPTL
jgi:hypothetical protein